jgi:hypothetical protein
VLSAIILADVSVQYRACIDRNPPLVFFCAPAAADLLNARVVLPFFDSHEVKLLRVLAIDRPFGQRFRNPKAQPQPGHVPEDRKFAVNCKSGRSGVGLANCR